MKARHAAALALGGWYLFWAAPARTQVSAALDSGIRGIVGCTPSWGNAPAGDPTWPCGRIVDSETGKDMGEVTCHLVTQGFTVPLPPGNYVIRLRRGNETKTDSVVVREHKWTDVEPWSKVCRPPAGPVA